MAKKPKPIRVFWSELGQRFYASKHYKITDKSVVITGTKYDVTDDIASAIIRHEISFEPVPDEQLPERVREALGAPVRCDKCGAIVEFDQIESHYNILHPGAEEPKP